MRKRKSPHRGKRSLKNDLRALPSRPLRDQNVRKTLGDKSNNFEELDVIYVGACWIKGEVTKGWFSLLAPSRVELHHGEECRMLTKWFNTWTEAAINAVSYAQKNFPNAKLLLVDDHRPHTERALLPISGIEYARFPYQIDFWGKYHILTAVLALLSPPTPSLNALPQDERREKIEAALDEAAKSEARVNGLPVRTDTTLTRMLTEVYGSELSMNWQRLPHVVIDRATGRRMVEMRPVLEENVTDLSALPWTDFVIEIPTTFFSVESNKPVPTFVRVTRFDEYDQKQPRYSPWMQKMLGTDKGRPAKLDIKTYQGSSPGLKSSVVKSDHLVLETFQLFTEIPERRIMEIWRRCGGPEAALLSPDDIWKDERCVLIDQLWMNALSPRELDKVLDDMTRHVVRIKWVLAYLCQCPDFIVEVKPPRQEFKPSVLKRKPWLRRDAPSVILLDPEHAKRSLPREHKGGSHASPIPHGRRGHHAKLVADRWYRSINPLTGHVWAETHNPNTKPRTVFRHPTVVGNPEFVSGGTKYRIVGRFKQERADGTVVERSVPLEASETAE